MKKCLVFAVLCVVALGLVGCVSGETRDWVRKVTDVQAHQVALLEEGNTTETGEQSNVTLMDLLWSDAKGFTLGMPGEAKAVIKANLERIENFLMLSEAKTRPDYQQEMRESAAGWNKLNGILSPDDTVVPGATKGGAE